MSLSKEEFNEWLSRVNLVRHHLRRNFFYMMKVKETYFFLRENKKTTFFLFLNDLYFELQRVVVLDICKLLSEKSTQKMNLPKNLGRIIQVEEDDLRQSLSSLPIDTLKGMIKKKGGHLTQLEKVRDQHFAHTDLGKGGYGIHPNQVKSLVDLIDEIIDEVNKTAGISYDMNYIAGKEETTKFFEFLKTYRG